MRIAVMQPYFFPYLGYWQLIAAVDRFVIFDDVNYINRGWINRNRIVVNGQPVMITVPLQGASQNKKIDQLMLLSSPTWRDKLIKTISMAYRKATHFDEVFPIIETLIRYETDSLSDYLAKQLRTLSAQLGIDTEFIRSSRIDHNHGLSGQDRIIYICKSEGASSYVNPIGGQQLYSASEFRDNGIELYFIAMRPVRYPQLSSEFISHLSIIDALMVIGTEGIKNYLFEFDLIGAETA